VTAANRYAVAALAILLSVIGVPRAQAQTLSAARELYAAAAYNEALTALNELMTKGESNADPGAVALYRALCLYGLGQTEDGDRAVETLVATHPLYHPPLDDLSPRIRTTVVETRRRMLPALLQQEYAEAKSAYERREFAGAAAGFTKVLTGLDDPDIAVAATQAPLADLRTLAAGFRDLAQKALVPPPLPSSAPAAVVVAAAVVAVPPRVYSAEDGGVVAPAAIRQAIPPYSRVVSQKKTAIVQLIIDDTGAVESATMVTPLDPQYDGAVLTAARGWQYEPARADGVPVKYRKLVQITLVPTPR
jgi:hypothetical protein